MQCRLIVAGARSITPRTHLPDISLRLYQLPEFQALQAEARTAIMKVTLAAHVDDNYSYNQGTLTDEQLSRPQPRCFASFC